MNYGQMIRKARKELSLNQSDLANNKISRTLVSEIEKGNTNLMTSKALLIYKKLIEVAYIKEVDITLDFDKVLEENIEYVQLKQGRDILSTLSDANRKLKELSDFELENYKFFALRSDIGIFKYYILREIASNIKNNRGFKVDILLSALDFLKWLNFKEVQEKYDETLKILTPLAYREGLFERLIQYYEYQKNQLIELKVFVEPRVYYNLSLLNEMIENYDISYQYLNNYLDYKSTLSLEDYYDALLAIPRLATKSKDYAKGIKKYESILSMIQKGTFIKQQSIALSNILFNIPKLKNGYPKEKIKEYLNILEDLLPEIIEKRDFPSDLFVNMSIGYHLIDEKNASERYLKKAFEAATTSKLKANVVIDAFNGIKDVSIDLLLENILLIDSHELRKKDSFMLILLKIQQELFEKNKKKDLALLKAYVNKI